ncbi:nacht domain containing protein [Grosmannia clavigera kw1407]|uniref:Mitochondrial division protein 1 n=1 Tax=Grosmannia clavigera (strain kw1407 / UAMH 11150) TaxID=655863 RepID=F0XQI2_GROCL|nr:nacht domain containing protein [Grosmannia clavigera kw1407]EFX00151.1 nacht domain containing protein [Grosmannia clavigera kw1407]
MSTPSDSELKGYESELADWTYQIREEVKLLENQSIKDQSSHLKALFRTSDSESRRQKERARDRVLKFCSTYKYQSTWREIRKVGSTTLLDSMPKYQQWKNRSDSCTLLCTGKLGSGKSVLLANMVDDLNLHAKEAKCPVVYFFSRHDNSESLKATTIIGSIARQFLHSIADLSEVEGTIDTSVSVPDLESIFALLKHAISPDFKAYVVLDGLDECDEYQRRTTIEQLRNLQKHFKLVICASFRLEADNILRLGPETFLHLQTIAIQDDNPDIKRFINAELVRCIKSGRLIVGDPTLVIEIEDALLQGTRGMFLWATLQIQSLCQAKTDEAIRQAITDLPKTLAETFSRILSTSAALGKNYQMQILHLVLAASRPLTTKELCEALSVVPGDAVWNPARLLNNVYTALACCGSLITVEEEDLSVRLVHHSVKQFLFGDFTHSSASLFTVEDAARTMGDIVVTYLSYNVFNTTLSTTVTPQIPSRSTPARIVSSIESGFVRSMALMHLQSRQQPNYDMGQVLAEASRTKRPPSVNEFHFYEYAKLHWPHHVGCISEDNELIYRQLSLLLQDRLSQDLNVVNDRGRTPLSWAAEYGRIKVAKLLLSHGSDPGLPDNDGRTPMIWAAKRGHANCVDVLLRNGAEVGKGDKDNRTSLSHAAEHGHKDTIVRLLEVQSNVDIGTAVIHRADPVTCRATLHHGDSVSIVVFSHNSRLVASGSYDGTVKIWDVPSRRTVCTLRKHDGAIRGVAFSHDSLLMASGSSDQTIRLWDAATGRCIQSLVGHNHDVMSVAFMRESAFVVSGSRDCSVRIWDLATGQCHQTLEGHTRDVQSVAVSHDSRIIASASRDYSVRFWDPVSGQCTRTLKAHDDYVWSVVFSHDSGRVATASRDHSIKIWHVATGECLHTLEGHSHEVGLLAFSHDSRLLASPSNDLTVKLWDTAIGYCVETLQGHTAIVESVTFSPDSKLLVSGSHDGTIKLWKASVGLNGVDIDCTDNLGLSPLQWAITKGHKVVEQLLLENGAI